MTWTVLVLAASVTSNAWAQASTPPTASSPPTGPVQPPPPSAAPSSPGVYVQPPPPSAAPSSPGVYVQPPPPSAAPSSPGVYVQPPPPSSVAMPPAGPAPAGLPPPPPGYMYVQTASPSAPAYGYTSAPSLAYIEGEPIPAGYRLRDEPRSGLVTGGYILSAIPWGISVMAALSVNFKNSSGYLLLPYVGPWMMIGRRNYSSCHDDSSAESRSSCVGDVLIVTGLVMDGLMQAGGGAMLLTGYLVTRKTLVRNDIAWRVAPQRLGSGYGLGISGLF